MRADCIRSTHDAVHHPGLPPHFSCEPPRQNGDDTCRAHTQSISPQGPGGVVVQTAAPWRPDPGHCQPDHQQTQTHHVSEGPKNKRDIGTLISWELLYAGKLADQNISRDLTAQINKFNAVTVT